MSYELSISEEQRQVTIMALAHLAVERPGWDHMLQEIALKIDNPGCPMFREFKAIKLAQRADRQ